MSIGFLVIAVVGLIFLVAAVGAIIWIGVAVYNSRKDSDRDL